MGDTAHRVLTPGRGKAIAARFGVFLPFLAEPENPENVAARVQEALEADDRVVDIRAGNRGRAQFDLYYPPPADASNHAPVEFLAAEDPIGAPWFPFPLRFAARVPVRNQPPKFPGDVPPTDAYEVVWDGCTALVCWEQESTEEVAMSGGYVVEDILAQACKKAGLDLYNQRCSYECSDQFAHAHVRAQLVTDQPDPTFLRGDSSLTVEAKVPAGTLEEMAASIFFAIRSSSARFAKMKNTGRRLVHVVAQARDELYELLTIQAKKVRAAELSLLSRLKFHWSFRKSRGHSRMIIANLWLAVVAHEKLRGEWRVERYEFLSATAESGTTVIFEQDDQNEAEFVESIDIERMQSAVEQVAGGLQVRNLIIATAGGAVVALAGVALERLL